MENVCGIRFMNIGLENDAVDAASVVEGPSRCSNKGVKGQKRRIKRLRVVFSTPPALKAPEPHRASSVWGTISWPLAHRRVKSSSVLCFLLLVSCFVFVFMFHDYCFMVLACRF